MVAGLTVVAIVAVIEQAWPFIEFSMPKKWVNGEPQPRYDVQSFLARYVLHHSHRRFIGIASETDHFQFNHARVSLGYGIFSDRYETYTDISHYLPVRPDPERKDVTFLLKNDEALARIRTVYPTGEVERHSVYEGEIVLITYTVTGGEIERVWRSEVTRRDSPFRDAFALKASS
jgi:hypothetical protein